MLWVRDLILYTLAAQALFLIAAICVQHMLHLARLLLQNPTREIVSHGRGHEVIVTLVHGTFSGGGRWFEADSEFQKSLCNAIKNRRLIIATVTWRGWNTLLSRRQGTLALIRHVRSVRRDYPNAKHFIIAHSHGGNVVVDAIHEPTINRLVDGAITVSTPYLTFLPVFRLKGLIRFTDRLVYCVAFLALAVIWGALYSKIPSPGSAILRITSVVLMLFLLAVAQLAVGTLLGYIARLVKQTLRRLDRLLSNNTVPPGKLLVLRTPSDEATLLLATLTAFCRLQIAMALFSFRLLRALFAAARQRFRMLPAWARFAPHEYIPLSWKSKRIESALNLILGAAILAANAILLAGALGLAEPLSWMGSPLGVVASIGFAGLFLLTLAMLPSALFFIPIAFLGLTVVLTTAIIVLPMVVLSSLICALAIGPGLTLGSLLSLPSVDGTPIGSCEVENLTPGRKTIYGSARPLVLRVMHSSILEDQTSLSKISSWIANRV
ncbi:hypothetical protein [Bradyrhizobium elkanii]